MGLGMNRQDLLELYQLAEMYRTCYGADIRELLEEIRTQYREVTGGEDIQDARNPRGAGRKRVYTKETDQAILELHGNGMALRRIANAAQCSIGHVQDVLKRYR